MSKTFKPIIETDRQFKVEQSVDARADFHLAIMDDFNGNKYVSFDNSDAPSLALAILRVAGYTEAEYVDDWPNVNRAVFSLRLGIEEQEREASRAKAQAELEAEALELFNTLQVEIHGILGPNWVNVTEFPNIETKRKWLAVARRARELGKSDSE